MDTPISASRASLITHTQSKWAEVPQNGLYFLAMLCVWWSIYIWGLCVCAYVCVHSYLSSRIDSVLRSLSSHVSFSSAMIFSVSWERERKWGGKNDSVRKRQKGGGGGENKREREKDGESEWEREREWMKERDRISELTETTCSVCTCVYGRASVCYLQSLHSLLFANWFYWAGWVRVEVLHLCIMGNLGTRNRGLLGYAWTSHYRRSWQVYCYC